MNGKKQSAIKNRLKLMKHITLENLQAYANAIDKAGFVAALLSRPVQDPDVSWLDSQFYWWASDLELV